MFLDDELIRIGKTVKLSHKRSIIKTAEKMLNACFQNFSKHIQEHKDDQTIIATFKRIERQLKIAVETLRKEGIDFIREDAFRIFCLNDPELKDFTQSILKRIS